ncbi:MAG: DNRLRE domain-containing protein [Proteobacteria bacterium]|nr:DNRLRE domain-containing protein [Pseudomonadota bacterium]
MKKAIVLFFFYMLSLYHPVSAETISVTADKDTYLDKLYPDTNFGQKWNLLMSGPATKLAHGLLRFDLSVLPAGARITKAQLTILVHANHSTNFYRIYPLSSPWGEDYATWNSASSGNDPAVFIEAALPSTTPRWMVVDVTTLISDEQGNLQTGIAAKGLLLKADAGYNRILSAEFSSDANAYTCHSCHGSNDPSLDVGKSTNCAQCHAQGDIHLSGEPTLIVTYDPMLFQFVQVSDTHIGKSSQQAANLSNAVAQINTINPAFVLFSGDLTDSGSLEQYSVFKTAVANLSMPYHCVPGDNDIVDGEGDLQRYREQLGDDYYTFDYQGFQFIGLDNNVETALDQVQREWLENELKKGKPEIIFAHKPLLNYQNCNPLPEAQQLVSLFDTYTVDMFMNGHDHLVKECILNNTSYIKYKNLSYAHMGDHLYRVYADRILMYHVDLRDGSETFAGSFPLIQPPTLVTISSLQAIPSNRSVTIRWVTESEIDNAGFNIYRTTPNGETIKINKNIILVQGSAAAGAVYEFADNTVENRKTYSYQLEDIDTNGTARLHGPVSATPRLLYLFK